MAEPLSGNSARNLAAGIHLASFAGFVLPLGNLLVPLIVWLAVQGRDQMVDDQAREALNFQLSMLIYLVVGGVLFLLFLGMIIVLGVIVAEIVCPILAARSIRRGVPYSYPFALRIVRIPPMADVQF